MNHMFTQSSRKLIETAQTKARLFPLPMDDRPVVYVIDDDISVRDALETLFETVGIIARTFASASEFLCAKVVDRLGCILIDVRLPDTNGLDLQTRLSQLGIALPVVMMTGHGDIPMSVRAMKWGAIDFLAKPFRNQDMLDAVMAGIERDRQRRAADGDMSDIKRRFETLSTREQQVMFLVTTGKMNKQVAADLGISEVTAKIHRGAAMRKMGARTLPDLVRMADALKLSRAFARAL